MIVAPTAAGPRPRHVPQRTCTGCRTVSAKRNMVRVVRTPEGRLEVDETGKRSGRGAYLCANASCWQQALKRGGLERALRTKISPEARGFLLESGRRLGLPL